MEAVMLDKSPSANDPSLLARFAAIVGDKYAITDPQAQLPYIVEMRDLYRGRTPLVLRPGSVAEVPGEFLKLADEYRDGRTRAAGRQYRARRWRHPAEQRDRAVGHEA